MPKAMILDFDGVITDSEIVHLRALNQVLSQYSLRISKKDYYKNFLGLSDRDLLDLLVSKGLLDAGRREIGLLLKQKKQAFEILAKTQGAVIEGVYPFLLMLRQNHIPLAICSGALRTEIELTLDQTGLRQFFGVIISAEQVAKGKPHPQGFLLALKKLNAVETNPILPSQCIVIEDSHWGLQAAKAAGMHTIAVTNSYDAEQLGLADKIVANLSELTIGDLRKICKE